MPDRSVILTVSDAADWRSWLDANAAAATEVWLVIRNKHSPVPGVGYEDAVSHALCYGWIDGHTRKHDADGRLLRFTPRSPRSTWSALNRERAARMIERGLMTPSGQAAIDHAKATGTWLVDTEIPPDLATLLDENPQARTHFDAFPPSSKRLILEWIAAAKRPETRLRRLRTTVDLAAENRRANHPGRP